MKVGIFLGSASDAPVMKDALEILKEFAVPFALEVASAHRFPRRTVRLVGELEKQGVEVFIAVAGKAAHLAGVVAAHTLKPVIGVPVGGSGLGGLDALLSTVQMPRGIPVASMGIGKSGGVNAALTALAILALKDEALAGRLSDYRRRMAEQVEKDSEKLKEEL